MSDASVTVFTSNHVTTKRQTLRDLVATMAQGAWADFKTTNKATAGKAAKIGAGVVVGGKVAGEMGAVTPAKWLWSGRGALPIEFIKSGKIQVFEFTTLQRALIVAQAAAAKFVLVTIAYEGGVVIGSVINQSLDDSTKDTIGGTINEIVNEGGWKLLYQHPFGAGM